MGRQSSYHRYTVERIYSPESRIWFVEKDEYQIRYEREVERENRERLESYKRRVYFDPDEVL